MAHRRRAVWICAPQQCQRQDGDNGGYGVSGGTLAIMQRIASRMASTGARFVASTRGVAATEFAMVVPVLLIIFLATFDAGRAIAIYMKVRGATYALAAITNQY